MSLRLADGSTVLPNGRVVPPGGVTTPRMEGIVAVPTNREAQQLVVAARRKLADLPDVPRTMNTINVVLCYTLFGLDDEAISIATKLSMEQIEKVRLTDAFTSMRDQIVSTVLNSESEDIRGLFVQHARNAASTVVDVMQSGKSADRLNAAKDILDRGGFRPNDVVEHRHQLEGGLTISIIRKDDNSLPTIDMEVESDDAD